MNEKLNESTLDKSKPVRFKPRARLLLQLGDQLIKNESIAIIELVKNSYDADANVVKLSMNNVDEPEFGTILIEDDGYGMNIDIVENVWLEPGSDFKSQKIKKQEVTPKYNRLPIGEKGIGRFGVHKLGSIIEMTTKSSDCNEVFVRIDWTAFEEYKYLEEVPITIVERSEPIVFKNGNTGTNILIKKLRKKWERGVARDVKRSLTALSSPFEKNDSFKTIFNIVDKPKWFEGLLSLNDIKDYSLFHFKITMSGTSIVDFLYEFTPWESMSKLHYDSKNLSDPLVSNWLNIKYPYGDNKDAVVDLNRHKIGNVVFEGYIFDQDAFVLKLGVADKTGFKNYLKTNGGVRVFRDNLRVYDYGEPENDWLGLDIRRVNQPAKRISNNILLGAVSINRKDSVDLFEKTNREGFIENSAYEDFRAAILHSVGIIEVLRHLDKLKLREKYGPTPKSSPVISTLGEAKKYVEDKVKETDVRNQIIKYFNKIESDYKLINENLLKAAGAGLSMSVVVHEVEKIIYEIEKVVISENASERTLKLVKHLSSLIDGYAEIIRKSNRSDENISKILDQSLFNTEFRLESHKIEVIKEYRNKKNNFKAKIAKNLLIGSLMNVIDNSIYWLDHKYIKSIENKETFTKKIFIDLSEDSDYVNIILSDNGTGFLIPTEDIKEPFVSSKPGGIGLGLHIANEIMEAQGGHLSFPDYGDFEMPSEFIDGATVVLTLKK